MTLAVATSTSAGLAAQTPSAAAPIVFFDVAGPDASAQASFYENVFGWGPTASGNLEVPVTRPLQGVIRVGANDTMIYIGVDDVTAALARIEAHGGRVDQPRFEVPGVVVLGIFFDPSGNRLGLVEMEGERAKVP